MTADDDARRPSSPTRRIAAITALTLGTLMLVLIVVVLVREPAVGLLAVVGVAAALSTTWLAVQRTGRSRRLMYAAAVVEFLVVVAVMARTGLFIDLALAVVGAVVVAWSTTVAFGSRGSAGGNWQHVPAAGRPALLVNPRSGDGRAERAGLAAEANARGVDTIVLQPGDDLVELARTAIEAGADVVGMAGGDGSMALVASLVAEHQVAFVCVPAGTRNHFALDLGVRREDLVGSLDAFSDGVEARIDLASVNDRIFVNNVSLGVYAEAVQEPGYRAAKIRTLGRKVREALGRDGVLPAIAITDDLGRDHESAAVVLVSNNPYALDRSLGRTTRPHLDGATLGITLIGRRRSRVWSAEELTVNTPTTAAAGIDGEAATLEPPLTFAVHPGVLRVRIASHHPGLSPSAMLPPRARDTLPRLLEIARGR